MAGIGSITPLLRTMTAFTIHYCTKRGRGAEQSGAMQSSGISFLSVLTEFIQLIRCRTLSYHYRILAVAILKGYYGLLLP
jgi:hypothetical protein